MHARNLCNSALKGVGGGTEAESPANCRFNAASIALSHSLIGCPGGVGARKPHKALSIKALTPGAGAGAGGPL